MTMCRCALMFILLSAGLRAGYLDLIAPLVTESPQTCTLEDSKGSVMPVACGQVTTGLDASISDEGTITPFLRGGGSESGCPGCMSFGSGVNLSWDVANLVQQGVTITDSFNVAYSLETWIVFTGGTGSGTLNSHVSLEGDLPPSFPLSDGAGITIMAVIGDCSLFYSPSNPTQSCPFTFGIPIELDLEEDANVFLSASYMHDLDMGGGLDGGGPIYVLDGDGNRVNGFGLSLAPEPSSVILCFAGLVISAALALRRFRSKV